jgi:two-component system chemotaxis response regulator CheB
MAFGIVVIGTSLGGLSALKVLLAELPQGFPLPIAIVQHRHKDSKNTMTAFLQQQSAMPLREVEDKEEIEPGYVYFAPADYHLLIEPGYFTLSTDEPVCFARPSIDVLFESAADVYQEKTIGVILTGANQDGAKGLAAIKARGGFVIVQDPATAEGNMMPASALAITAVDKILPLSEIAAQLVSLSAPARR